MNTRMSLLLVLAMLLAGCTREPKQDSSTLPNHSGTIKVAGAYALYPLVNRWTAEFSKTHPGVIFDIQTIGSGAGIELVMEGNCDIAMVSGDIPEAADSLLFFSPAAALAVVPIINSSNPYLYQILHTGLKREDLLGLFTGKEVKSWGTLMTMTAKDCVAVYKRSDKSGATDILARFLCVSPEDIRGTGEDGDPAMIEAVRKDPMAIGYCNFIYAVDLKTMDFVEGIRVLPMDCNRNGRIDFRERNFDSVSHLQRAMWLGKFPCALTRDLFLATRGKPQTREVKDFLVYIMTEGQEIVEQSGYIQLHSSEIAYGLQGLK